MKIYKLAYGMVAAAFLTFTSCSNDQPSFNDADAFVAMTNSTASVSETEGSIEIPVLLTSLSGIETTVDFEITIPETAGAVEGEHFTLVNSSKTLTFTKDAPTQIIKLNIIDNDEFDGDVNLTISLVNPNGVNLGANATCKVTINDDEHPLAAVLGTYTGVGDSNWGDALNWTVQIVKDADDLSKVWIYNLVPGGTTNPVYGTVNAEKTEIAIPIGQTIYESSSYDGILEAFYGPDGAEDIPSGDSMIGVIANGTITFNDYFGSHAYKAGTTTSAGWFEIVIPGAKLTKQQ
mgnify:CR=1 FL=1